MKQRKLIRKVYKACIEHDEKMLQKLQRKEFEKIFKHKEQGKLFDSEWTVVRI